ncbi:SDR family NAD(P)-dependent oxidoreductase [Microvirga sp. G4-2]|uniref:SDR family NAD(P)-dependent oxidoreductase n=1 Tax=Microvirga sp. G4-2 TaxID=3434467 RepID=UPI004044CBDB
MAATDVSADEWDRQISISLSGVFFCLKHRIPLMLKQGGGVIVSTSSGAGVKGPPGQAA